MALRIEDYGLIGASPRAGSGNACLEDQVQHADDDEQPDEKNDADDPGEHFEHAVSAAIPGPEPALWRRDHRGASTIVFPVPVDLVNGSGRAPPDHVLVLQAARSAVGTAIPLPLQSQPR